MGGILQDGGRAQEALGTTLLEAVVSTKRRDGKMKTTVSRSGEGKYNPTWILR